ncbi:uncharacterized protein LOC130962142 [Arachis stenosperma]|uniref:uncharacterized protein LOC130962142 n=1 Tax=Arachis stenosperma TaxID=217475 RepID=UPI0025ABF8BB|nr:uncharacterized protein LOC130962142 [Arachis stenosperma]
MAQRSIRTFKDRIKWLATIQGGEWLKEIRGNLAMVASVIATMTFQIGLNPPGGVVQNGDKGFIKCPTPKGNDQACPGQSVFAFADKDIFRHGDGAFVGFIALFVVLGCLFILRLAALCFEIEDREGTPTPSTAAAPTTDES